MTHTIQNFHEGELLLVNKPLGWTSFDVVNKLKYATKAKVGHAGTLDPLAQGLLLVCTGKMTKQISQYSGMDKVYEGTIFMGATTPSYDAEQPIDHCFPIEHLRHEDLLLAAKQFEGDMLQVPPIFSALKKNGKKAYEAARAGVSLLLDPRPVVIHCFDITKIELPLVHFKVKCSKGTYIRSLAHDFGKVLNNGAYLASLNRTEIGPFKSEQAWELPQLIEAIKNHPEWILKK